MVALASFYGMLPVILGSAMVADGTKLGKLEYPGSSRAMTPLISSVTRLASAHVYTYVSALSLD